MQTTVYKWEKGRVVKTTIGDKESIKGMTKEDVEKKYKSERDRAIKDKK